MIDNNPRDPAKTVPVSDTSVTDALVLLVSDTFGLFAKTWGYHWDIVGPEFIALHHLLGDQYGELYEAIDTIAEQARSLGALIPMDFADASSIPPGDEHKSCDEMLADLIEGHKLVLSTVEYALRPAQGANDQGTMTILADRQNAHNKHIWFLQSHLAGDKHHGGREKVDEGRGKTPRRAQGKGQEGGNDRGRGEADRGGSEPAGPVEEPQDTKAG